MSCLAKGRVDIKSGFLQRFYPLTLGPYWALKARGVRKKNNKPLSNTAAQLCWVKAQNPFTTWQLVVLVKAHKTKWSNRCQLTNEATKNDVPTPQVDSWLRERPWTWTNWSARCLVLFRLCTKPKYKGSIKFVMKYVCYRLISKSIY